MKKRRSWSKKKKLFVLFLSVVFIAAISPFAARLWMYLTSHGRIYTEVEDVPECRVAVVLGAKVYPNGRLSLLLMDRVNMAVDLYKAGKVEKLLMSGDNRFEHYDEPTRMAEYAIRKGVDPKDVAMDFAGRRTYDSVYRAKHTFGLDKCVIVSQGFHLDRAVFLCRKLGVEGYGLAADEHMDMGGRIRQARIREIPACFSALLDVYILHPKPVPGKKEEI